MNKHPDTPFLEVLSIEMNSSCNYTCGFCNAHQDRLDVIKQFNRGEGDDALLDHPDLKNTNLAPNEGVSIRPRMTISQFKNLVDQAVELNPDVRINPQKAGEPFLHPDIEEAIDYIKEKGAKLYMTTNGSLLDARRREWLIDIGADDLIISIDGFTKETFEKIRGSDWRDDQGRSPYEATVQNTLDLIRERDARGKELPRIHLSYCLQPTNYNEMEAAKDFWQDKCESMNFCNVIVGKEYKRPFFAVDHSNHGPCQKLWSLLFVMSDGEVTCCSIDSNIENPVGNAFKTPLREIWLEGKQARMREDHIAGRFDKYPTCKDCHHYTPRNHFTRSYELIPERSDIFLQKDLYEGFVTYMRQPMSALETLMGDEFRSSAFPHVATDESALLAPRRGLVRRIGSRVKAAVTSLF